MRINERRGYMVKVREIETGLQGEGKRARPV